MWEWPDKRVWWFMAPVFPLAIAFTVLPLDHRAVWFVELALYAWCVVVGISIGLLSLREGYSLCHPSTTVDEWPVLYWIEVLIGYFVFAAIGAWKTFRVVSDAL